MEGDIEDMLEQAVVHGMIECPDCGNMVEPDGDCYCGWKNPLLEGWI
ncbi:MAG: hypothetical protein ACTSWQ_06670 [Candidatus Thorarchaeota archaeon]